MRDIADKLKEMGHKIEMPLTAQKILSGELTLEEFKKEKTEQGDAPFRRKLQEDVIRRYYNIIKTLDAVLIINKDKKGIKNYIGANTFLEIAFAHVLNKKIYLLNDLPEFDYPLDELKAMTPIVLNGDLNKITGT